MSRYRDGDCWPTPLQRLLLRAALCQSEAALKAWTTWHESIDIDRLDSGSFRLLPLLFRNLTRHGVDHEWMEKLKGVYRLTWYRNQIRFRDLEVTLGEFHKQELDVMLLKGTALAADHYQDIGVRPMEDADILVRTSAAREALELVGKAGWRPEYWSTAVNVAYLHGIGLVDTDGQRLDLHWHALEECCWPSADHEFWEHSVATTIGTTPVRTLSPAHLLLHVLVHGVRWNRVPSLRWVADCVTLINSPSGAIEWASLVHDSIARQVALSVYHGLEYLKQELEAPVPGEVLKALGNAPMSTHEIGDFQIKTRRSTPWRRLQFHICNHQRLVARTGIRGGWNGFLIYLRTRWGLDCVWQMPGFIVTEVVRIIGDKYRNRGLYRFKTL